MNRRVLLVGPFLIAASLACLGGPSLSPPKESSGKDVPLYRQGTQIPAGDTDKAALVGDLIGPGTLRYFSTTDIRVTADAAATVGETLDSALPDSGWRLETDWSSIGQSSTTSTWRNGDLRATVILLDNLDSGQISDLRKRYGLSGLEPGNTLVVTHVWDPSRPIPTATPTAVTTPTATPANRSLWLPLIMK